MSNSSGYSGVFTEAQAKAAWDGAIPLLKGAGIPEYKARALFGKLVRDVGHAGALLPAVEAARRAQTGDPVSYLSKAANSVRNPDPALQVSWT